MAHQVREHIEEQGQDLYEQVSALEIEGMVAKRAASLYKVGRSRDWLKIKTHAGRALEAHRRRHLE